MVSPERKLNVFISSICGEGKLKYNLTRKALKELIRQTGFANVYLFEGTGPSALSAEQHYLYSEGDSDLCVFIIDNAEPIPNGVQEEIDYAEKHHIKSHFYFCTENSKEQTPLQKSLTGKKFAKSRNISSFEELIANGTQWLIDDIALVYKSYCNGNLADAGEWEAFNIFALNESYFRTSFVTPKSIIENSDKCSSYFCNLLNKEDFEVKHTNDLDNWSYQFLDILFSGKSIDQFNVSMFLKELKKHQTEEYHSTVMKRWDAIQAYFSGNLEDCVDCLKEALEITNKNKLPDWVINDILIDLRNQKMLLDKLKNTYMLENDAQKQLTESENALYYPLIDRFQKTLYEKYIQNLFKEKIKSPFTITLGHNIEQYTDLLASSYIAAMFNGSLTHILKLYEQIKWLSFSLCELFSDWELRMLLLKCAIIDSSEKEIEGITRSFSEILIKLSADEALEIFSICYNIPIPCERLIAQLKAYSVVGYFLDENNFGRITDELLGKIRKWLDEDQNVVVVGDYIFFCPWWCFLTY